VCAFSSLEVGLGEFVAATRAKIGSAREAANAGLEVIVAAGDYAAPDLVKNPSPTGRLTAF
jgi:hypothetical protein